jgi:CelD/BcsL family acetyltransferase involved in cellulose biosynthesis
MDSRKGAEMAMSHAVDPTLAGVVGFDKVLPAWQALGENASYFFQTPQWVACLSHHIDADVVFGALVDGHRPVAVSILRRSLRRRWGINLKVLYGPGYLGDGPLFADGLLAPDADDRCSFDEIMRHLGSWHVMRLRRLRIGSPWLVLAGDRGCVEEEPDEGVGVLDTGRDADGWWREMPKNMRDSIRKARGRCERDGGSEVVVSTGGDVAGEFEQFLLLDASGWKGRQETDLSHTPAWRSLFLDYLLASDTAEVRSLKIDGRNAASQLTVRVGRTLFLLKIAYDEQLAMLSPGNLLMANLVEACCEDPNVDRIDCIVWQPWHQRWGMVREPTFGLTAFNSRSVRGALAGIAWNARRRLVDRRHR